MNKPEQTVQYTGDPALDLVFFGPALCLASEVDKTTMLANPRRQLARQLLLSQPPAAKQVMAGLLFAPARLQRACALVHDLCRPGGHQDFEALRLLDEEWLWCARSWRIRRLLHRKARSLGLADPDAVVKDVLAAARDELIPGLHLRAYLATTQQAAGGTQSAAAERHGRWLSAWTLSRKPSPGGVYIYACCLLALARNQAEPPVSLAVNLKWVAGTGSATSRMVQDGLYTLLRELVNNKLTGGVALRWIERQLWLLEQFERLAPPHLGLLTFQSLFHLIAGLRTIDAAGNTHLALLHLAQSVVYDPHNAQGWNSISQVEKRYEAGRLLPTVAWSQPYKGFRKAVLHMRDYQTSAAARQISNRRQHAIVLEIGHRLSLPASAYPQAVQTITDLLDLMGRSAAACVEQSHAEGLSFASVFQAYALHQRPALASLPWPLLARALQEGPPATTELLIEALPRREAIDLSALISALPGRAEMQPGAEGGVRVRHLLTWVASPRDMLFKLAGLCGLALLLVDGAHSLSARARRAEDTLLYRRVLAGIRDEKDDEVIAAAAAFLSATPERRDDPRVGQIAGFADAAILRQTIARTKAGRESEARELLALWARLSQRAYPDTAEEESVTDSDFDEIEDSEDGEDAEATAAPPEGNP